MADPSTQSQFLLFLQFLRHCTGTVNGALFYAGILAGLIAFPIYAVVLIRRHTRVYMDQVLMAIAERDPWLMTVGHGEGVFATEEPFEWLQDLCKWQARYHGVRMFFGSPDLEAKCIQVTKALLAVFLSWADNIKLLSREKQERLIDLLNRMKKRSADPSIDRLLRLLGSSDDPLGWLRPIWEGSREMRTWETFLQEIEVPIYFSPTEAAAAVELTREKLAVSMFLFSRKNLSFRQEIEEFLSVVHELAGQTVRLNAVLVDRMVGAKGALVSSLRAVVEGDPELSKLQQHPAWQQYVLAFGATPLAALNAAPADSFRALRKKFNQRMHEIHVGDVRGQSAVEAAKSVDLAWQALLVLKKDGLVG